MMRSKYFLLNSVVILTLGFPGFTKTPILTGKMVAYNPLRHAGKVASYEANREEVILETPARKKGFVKVVFISYGTTQIDPKYFDGTIPLEVHVLRDHECDEKLPTIAAEMSLNQRAGTYLLTEAFKNNPPPKMKTLECYDATGKK